MSLISRSEINQSIAFDQQAHIDDIRMKYNSSQRKGSKVYANVVIKSCQYENWWYNSFIGVECFCELRFANYADKIVIKEAVVVRLTNSKQLLGRTIDAKDFNII